MEFIIGGLILLQGYTVFMTQRDRKSLLNAVMAKSTNEFMMLERTPKRKTRKVPPVQDDAGIPFGL